MTSLATVNLDANLGDSDGAFENTYIKTINIGSNVISIGNDLFKGAGITTVGLPSGLKFIGTGAFENCVSLSRITIPAGVVSIGTTAFFGCAKLSPVEFLGSGTVVAAGAFEGEIPSMLLEELYRVNGTGVYYYDPDILVSTDQGGWFQ